MLTIRGSRMRVRLERRSINFDVEEGGPVELSVRGEPLTVFPGTPAAVPLADQGPLLASLGSHPVVGGRREDGSVVQAVLPESHPQDIVEEVS